MNLQYAAGFVDGEGCIQLAKPSKRGRSKHPVGNMHLLVSVVNNHRGILEEFEKEFGGFVSKKPRFRSNYWQISGKKAASFLHLIEPFLVIKRPQAQAALLFAETLLNTWKVPSGNGPYKLTDEGLKLRILAVRAHRKAIEMWSDHAGVTWRI